MQRAVAQHQDRRHHPGPRQCLAPPFTCLEVGALQSLDDPVEHWSDDPAAQVAIDNRDRLQGWEGLTLIGTDESSWR